jgi:hypothetical protein
MIVNAMPKRNLLAKKTNHGAGLNVFLKNGFAMVILTALMVLMRT